MEQRKYVVQIKSTIQCVVNANSEEEALKLVEDEHECDILSRWDQEWSKPTIQEIHDVPEGAHILNPPYDPTKRAQQKEQLEGGPVVEHYYAEGEKPWYMNGELHPPTKL